ncbi:MAG: HEAT repeat domain-containing protein [Leptospiraceae bacterium]|nr:HEAT repeat domain-containing protein [Leptospiraceae bacterium]MCK6379918.1 HEAT repeat domain-containing protein [Leptospiraceae bacterium]
MAKIYGIFILLFLLQTSAIYSDSTGLSPKELYFQKQINDLQFGYLEERLEAVTNLRIFKNILAVRSLISVLKGDNVPNSVVNTPILKYYISKTLAGMGQDIAIKPIMDEYKKYESTINENDKPFLDEKTEYSLLMALGEMLRSLGELPYTVDSYNLIKSALTHKNYYIRASAADSIKRANRKEGIEILISALQNEKSEYPKVAILNAILALEKNSGKYFLQLMSLLKSSDPNVRYRASVGIGELDIKAAEPFLKDAILVEDVANVRLQMKKDLEIVRSFRLPDTLPGLKN